MQAELKRLCDERGRGRCVHDRRRDRVNQGLLPVLDGAAGCRREGRGLPHILNQAARRRPGDRVIVIVRDGGLCFIDFGSD